MTGAQLIRRLNKKDGKGSWRIRTVCGNRQIQRKVNEKWIYWKWATKWNIASEAVDRLPQENVT